MKSILLLTLILPSAGSDIEWKSDLAEAVKSAREQEKLILLRQVICSCNASECDTMSIARSPKFMEDHARRHMVKDNFVFVLQHTSRRNMSKGLKFDPEFAAKKKKKTASIRTVFLTPTLHVLHRFDLCKRGWDSDVEIAFAIKLANECYEKDGTPVKSSLSTS